MRFDTPAIASESLWRRVGAYLRPPPDIPVTDTSPGAVAAQRVESANEAAWRSYVPKPWNGRLTYFASTEQAETIWKSPRARWDALMFAEEWSWFRCVART